MCADARDLTCPNCDYPIRPDDVHGRTVCTVLVEGRIVQIHHGQGRYVSAYYRVIYCTISGAGKIG